MDTRTKALIAALALALATPACATNRSDREAEREVEVERPGPDYEEELETETEVDPDPGELERETEVDQEIEDGPTEYERDQRTDVEMDGDELEMETRGEMERETVGPDPEREWHSEVEVDRDPGEVEIETKTEIETDAPGERVVTLEPVVPTPQAPEGDELRISKFELNESALNDADKAMLRKHADWIGSHPGASIVIEPHADEVTSGAADPMLGERRAEAVVAYLRAIGVDTTNMQIVAPAQPGAAAAATGNYRIEIQATN